MKRYSKKVREEAAQFASISACSRSKDMHDASGVVSERAEDLFWYAWHHVRRERAQCG